MSPCGMKEYKFSRLAPFPLEVPDDACPEPWRNLMNASKSNESPVAGASEDALLETGGMYKYGELAWTCCKISPRPCNAVFCGVLYAGLRRLTFVPPHALTPLAEG